MTGSRQRTPEEAQWLLGMLKQLLLVLGIVYLALHGWVSLTAYLSSGVLAGIVTFITLGFGDLYWAVTGFGESPANRADWSVAFAATVMAFLSWGTRPFTQQYILGLALQAMRQPEAATRIRGAPPRANENRGAVDDQRPGGAA
jgi:hypothetical protein